MPQTGTLASVVEHIELLDYLLRSNKSNINQKIGARWRLLACVQPDVFVIYDFFAKASNGLQLLTRESRYAAVHGAKHGVGGFRLKKAHAKHKQTKATRNGRESFLGRANCSQHGGSSNTLHVCCGHRQSAWQAPSHARHLHDKFTVILCCYVKQLRSSPSVVFCGSPCVSRKI